MPLLHSSLQFRPPFHLIVITAFLLLHISYTLAGDVLLPQAKQNNVGNGKISKRELHVRERMASQAPTAVRKMSGDQGEKFFLDYWEFEGLKMNEKGFESSDAAIRFPLDTDTENEAHVINLNVTSLQHKDSTSSKQEPNSAYLPTIAKHRERWGWMENLVARSLLGKRQFQCPQGTNECSGITRPDSCCAVGEECIILEDSGIGDVGCCPEGASCAGGVSGCDEDAGFSDCPNSPNGGCCIPGYRCQDEGCVIVDTLVVTPAPTVRASTTTTRSLPTTTTTSPSSTTPSSSTTRRTTPSSTSTLTRTTSTRLSSSSISVTVTTTAAAPLRPTAATSPPSDFCPTGFYACSAIYHGGCCRIDRNCDSTSCPPPPSNTVVDANGVTILASDGVEAAGTFPTGDCASGWVACGADDGFGCCPSGFECGESCVARVTETEDGDDGDDDVEVVAETVAKIGPENGAGSARVLSGMFGLLSGADWVLLLSLLSLLI